MLPFKLVYHDRYDLRLGAHVFPSQKFRLIRDALLAEGFADPADILSPEPASDEDVLRVHTRGRHGAARPVLCRGSVPIMNGSSSG